MHHLPLLVDKFATIFSDCFLTAVEPEKEDIIQLLISINFFTSSVVNPLMMKTSFMDSVSILHEYPILIAVSCLSPVRTQILIFAFDKFRIVSGTPS